MTLQRCLILYVGLPVFLALFNGVRGSVWAPDLSTVKTVLMFVACGLPTYGFAAITAHLLLPIMPLIRLPAMFALLFSAIATLPFSYFVVIVFLSVFGGFYPSLQPLLHETGIGLGDGFFDYITGSSGILIGPIWIGAQYLYERISGDVLFFRGLLGRSEAPEARSDSGAPAAAVDQVSPFLNKMKRDLGRKIVALEAQEHYVKVYTDKGEGLILYRFGDAVQEVAQCRPGLRVHRSYWVAEDAVSDVLSAKKSYKLKLSNGLEVPVSNSYRKVVEQYLVMKPDLQVQS